MELAFNLIKAHLKYRSRGTILKQNPAKALGHAFEIMKPIERKSVKGYYSNFFDWLRAISLFLIKEKHDIYSVSILKESNS